MLMLLPYLEGSGSRREWVGLQSDVLGGPCPVGNRFPCARVSRTCASGRFNGGLPEWHLLQSEDISNPILDAPLGPSKRSPPSGSVDDHAFRLFLQPRWVLRYNYGNDGESSLRYARDNCLSFFHPVGTCRMGKRVEDSAVSADSLRSGFSRSVSYTHLTLPTKA